MINPATAAAEIQSALRNMVDSLQGYARRQAIVIV